MAAQSLGGQVTADDVKASTGHRRQILLAAAAILAVVAIAVLAGVSQYAGAKQDMVSALETGADHFDTVFREAMESRLQSLRLAAEIMARDDGVAGALANRDRGELGQQTVAFYNDTLKPRFGLSILGFQTPDGIMFFRAHRPQLLGDDAMGRAAVASVLKTRVSIAGIELGRTGPELRALTPVIVRDALVGSVEVGSGILEPLQIASRATGLDFAFAMDQKASEALDRPSDARTDLSRGGAIYFAFSRPDARATLQATAFDPALAGPRVIEAPGRTVFVETIPVNDIGGSPVTRVTVLRDLTPQLAELRTSILIRTASIAAAIVLLVLFGLFRFRSLRASLEHSFAGRMQELRDKARAYDSVRQGLRDVDAWKIAIVNELVLLLKDPLIAVQGALDSAAGGATAAGAPGTSALGFAAAEVRRLRSALDAQLEVVGLRSGWRRVAVAPVALGALIGPLADRPAGREAIATMGEASHLQVAGDPALLRSAFAALLTALDQRAEMDLLGFRAEARGREIVGRISGPGRWRTAPPRLDDLAPLGGLPAGEPDDGLAVACAAFEHQGGRLEVIAEANEIGFAFTLQAA